LTEVLVGEWLYWVLQESTTASAQDTAPSAPSTILSAGLVAGIVGLFGVLVAQYFTGRRHNEALEHASKLEAQRAQEAALQKYFEQVGELLVDKQLRRATPSDHLSTVARAQTLAVLQDLDSHRKRTLVQFLYGTALLNRNKVVVSLKEANLREANLGEANLEEAALGEVILREAVLRDANLGGIILQGADLGEADLRGVSLREADLSGAILRGVKVNKSALREADLNGANLQGADLREADLREADLNGANLQGADLREAILTKANLRRANLRGPS
jgi:uncharacterized protein YjbI with pentapeptide repeats